MKKLKISIFGSCVCREPFNVEPLIKKEILFSGFNHPHPKVIRELANRIFEKLSHLNIYPLTSEYLQQIDYNEYSFHQNQAVYPCVYNALNIVYIDKLCKPNALSTTLNLSFKDYIKCYYNCYRGEK